MKMVTIILHNIFNIVFKTQPENAHSKVIAKYSQILYAF